MAGYVSAASRDSLVHIVSPSIWQQFTDFANVLKAFIGTSYLSLPFAFSQSGLVLGAIALVIIATITDHCCQLIIKCKNAAVDMILDASPKYQELRNDECHEEMARIKELVEKEMTLGDIGKIAIGPWGNRIVNIALVITQTGFCVAYFIFMGNTIAEMFPVIFKTEDVTLNGANTSTVGSLVTFSYSSHPPITDPVPDFNSSTMVPPLPGKSTAPLFVLLVLIPLPFLVAMAYVRSVRQLGPISGIANITLLAGFLGLLIFLLKGFHFKLEGIDLANLATFPVFFGQLTGAYEGIGTVIPIESSMAENRPRFPLYLHLALGQVSCILGAFGILGYMIYGSNVPQIVTNRLSPGIPAQLVRVTLIVAVMFTYPLQLFPVIEIAESVFFTKVQSKDHSHLSGVISGPSLSVSNNGSTSPVLPASSHAVNSSPVLDSSGSMLSASDNETQILLPKDVKEPQFKVSGWKRNLLRTVLVLITAGIAVLLKDEFAYVNAFIGSMGSSVLAYILPCVFHLVLFKNTNSVAVVMKDIIFIIFGVVGGLVGVAITVENVIKKF